MSKAFADVLLSCNLGKTKIIPIRFFDLVSQEYVNETTYYLLNVAEKYQYFLPKQSDPSLILAWMNDDGTYYYSAPSDYLYHQKYVYSSKALSCPVDLWNDPTVNGSLFVSDKLRKALQEKGFDTLVNLWKCQLADV